MLLHGKAKYFLLTTQNHETVGLVVINIEALSICLDIAWLLVFVEELEFCV